MFLTHCVVGKNPVIIIISVFVLISLNQTCFINRHRNIFGIEQKHISALILARGDSKGIKLKNLAKFGNETLLSNSLKVLLELNEFTSVWVSTDNQKIFEESILVSKNTNVHWRSEESATDTATSIFAAKEFLSHHQEIDIIALIQCTSPFIKRKYISSALKIIKNQPYNCVFSATRSYKLRWNLINGTLVPLNFNPNSRPRRQDWNGELTENGMFYMATRDLLNTGTFQGSRSVMNCIFLHNYQQLTITVISQLPCFSLMLNTTRTRHSAEKSKSNFCNSVINKEKVIS